MTERAAWERQPGETSRAFAAFAIYRDMSPGERSLRATRGPRRGHAARTVRTWSVKNRWVERAAAWDAEQDRVRREAFTAKTKELAEQQAAAATFLMGKGLSRLQSMEKISDATALRMIEVAVRIRREAHAALAPPLVSDVDDIELMTELLGLLAAAARNGDLSAIERFAKLSEVRARRLGLDAPQKHEVALGWERILEELGGQPGWSVADLTPERHKELLAEVRAEMGEEVATCP
jgi:hypothetical protein